MATTIRTAINIMATGELGWTSPFAQVISSLQNVAEVYEATLQDGQVNVAITFPNMPIINTFFFYAQVAGFSVRLSTLGNTPFTPLLPGGIIGFANASHVFATNGTMYVSYVASPTAGVPGRFFVAVAGT